MLILLLLSAVSEEICKSSQRRKDKREKASVVQSRLDLCQDNWMCCSTCYARGTSWLQRAAERRRKHLKNKLRVLIIPFKHSPPSFLVHSIALFKSRHDLLPTFGPSFPWKPTPDHNNTTLSNWLHTCDWGRCRKQTGPGWSRRMSSILCLFVYSASWCIPDTLSKNLHIYRIYYVHIAIFSSQVSISFFETNQ